MPQPLRIMLLHAPEYCAALPSRGGWIAAWLQITASWGQACDSAILNQPLRGNSDIVTAMPMRGKSRLAEAHPRRKIPKLASVVLRVV